MNQSPQSIPSRRRKCCRCNGVNAHCKFCAFAKANRACTDCLLSKHRCCQNAPTSITASNVVSTDSVSSSQPPYQHTSSFPDSQQLPLSQPLPQLPPTSLPTNASHTHCRTQPPPNPTVPLPHLLVESPLPSTPTSPIPPTPSLVAQQLHGQTQLPALIPEPKSPGQGPSHSSNPPCSHFIRNEVQFQLPSSPSLEWESQSATCCKCHSSGARCMSCKCSREERPCVNCYPGRRGKCANIAQMLSSYLYHRHNQRLFFNPIAHILYSANRDHFHSLPCLGHLRLRVSPLSRMNRLAMLLGHSLYTPPLWRLPLMFQCLHTPHFHQWLPHSHV